MGRAITIQDLIQLLPEGPVVFVRGMAWHVAGIRQQADRTDGTMCMQLKLMRQDPQDATARRLSLEVELTDTVQLVEDSAA